MRCWLSKGSEWYPVLELRKTRDIATSLNYRVDIPQELWDEWKQMLRDFAKLQTKLYDIKVKEVKDVKER